MTLKRRTWIRFPQTTAAYLAAFLFAICVLPARTANAQGASPEGAALLERMVSAYEAAERLQADFVVESCWIAGGRASGNISLERPCCLRVAFDAPDAKIFMATAEAQFEFFPEENKAYQYRPDTGFRPTDAYELFLSMRQYVAYVRPIGVEDMGDGLKRVRLIPVNDVPQVAEILCDIEEPSGFLRRAVVRDQEGLELGSVLFENYRMPAEWREGFFEPPSDASVFTPMTEQDFLNSDR